MQKTTAIGLFIFVLLAAAVTAQTTLDEPTGQKALAATMNVYVFPAKGEPADQQNREEAECYNWAVANTGTDPFDLAKQAEQQQQQAEAAKEEVAESGRGAGAKGALIGAAGGALIGEVVSDDAGRGAAIGAAGGAIGARRARRRAQTRAIDGIDEESAGRKQATESQIENFRKAFSVCLEAKD